MRARVTGGMAAAVAALTVAAAVLVACGSNAPPAPKAATSAIGSDVGSLVAAQHPECGSVGQEVVRYLESGDNQGRPALDQTFASERAAILGEPPDARPALIRSAADGATEKCDQALDAQASQRAAATAAAAQSAAAAEAAASAAAHAQAVDERKRATCQRVGGTWSQGGLLASSCEVSYRSPGDGQAYKYSVDFDANGNVIPSSCADTGFSSAHNCTSEQETLQQARTDCESGSYNGQQGTWHADTDICSL
jgi:hypothetical protein